MMSEIHGVQQCKQNDVSERVLYFITLPPSCRDGVKQHEVLCLSTTPEKQKH